MNLTQKSYLWLHIFQFRNLFHCVAESWWNMQFKRTRHGNGVADGTVAKLLSLWLHASALWCPAQFEKCLNFNPWLEKFLNFVWALKTAWNPWKVLELFNFRPWIFFDTKPSEINLSKCKSFHCLYFFLLYFFWICFNLSKTGHWLIGLRVHCQFATWLHISFDGFLMPEITTLIPSNWTLLWYCYHQSQV